MNEEAIKAEIVNTMNVALSDIDGGSDPVGVLEWLCDELTQLSEDI